METNQASPASETNPPDFVKLKKKKSGRWVRADVNREINV